MPVTFYPFKLVALLKKSQVFPSLIKENGVLGISTNVEIVAHLQWLREDCLCSFKMVSKFLRPTWLAFWNPKS